jgi:hypothetical protein
MKAIPRIIRLLVGLHTRQMLQKVKLLSIENILCLRKFERNGRWKFVSLIACATSKKTKRQNKLLQIAFDVDRELHLLVAQ